MNSSDKQALPWKALVLAESERMGTSTQQLRAEVTDLLAAGDDVDLRIGKDLEDDRDRDRLLLLLPADPINGLAGYFVFGVGASGPESAAISRVRILRDDSRFSIRIEVKSGTDLEGSWAYSRRPKIRKVALPGFDDPLSFSDGTIFHAAEFPQAALKPTVPADETGSTVLDFELPETLLQMGEFLDGCEQLVEMIDSRNNGLDLEWSEESLSREFLDEAAAEIECRALPKGLRFNLTFEAPGLIIVRGKRLQPMVRYPLTLIRRDGTRAAATLGCSVSKSKS